MEAPIELPDDHEPRLKLLRWSLAWQRKIEKWGYRRIQGALANLGHLLAHNTIADILKQHGIEPAPERSRKTTWKSSSADIGSRLSPATFSR
ncbi:MAG: IS3 family transposase [Acidobacteria bacterium]|nr:IS3 family transposase [Acidobacteriota bacterium]MCI0719241.1 IS3 family transposase [Acidobacteriota bacterium]